jgi:hypothetical protein
MASADPASSSHQPFANPQPAPVPATSQATSPPTKQSLKSWWKTFRPPGKNQDTPGKYSSPKNTIQPDQYFSAGPFVSRLSKDRDPLFKESVMNESVSIIDGLPPVEDVSQAPLVSQTNPVIPRRRIVSSLGFQQGSGLTQRSSGYFRRSLQVGPASVNHSPSPMLQTPLRTTAGGAVFGRGRVSTADNISDTIDMGAGILPGPSSRPANSHFFSGFFSILRPSSKEKAKMSLQAAETPTGIFGIPLRQSITYANVAISLVDAEGKSYIYGYVPIVVAKCGVYLKEKGL